MELRIWLLQARQVLEHLYDEKEAAAIIWYLLEEKYGFSKQVYWSAVPIILDEQRLTKMNADLGRLQKQEPVQYIVGHAWMAGKPWKVAPGVLIPRPETEQLADWVIRENNGMLPHLVDVCSGTACLGGSITAELGGSLLAIDHYEVPLRLSRENLQQNLGNSSDWEVLDLDVLTAVLPLEGKNLLVCNPPYVTPAEKEEMAANVLTYEPHTALFVPEQDPLLFYRVIANQALMKMEPGAVTYWELNPDYARETQVLLEQIGFRKTALMKDLQDKQRFLKAVKPD